MQINGWPLPKNAEAHLVAVSSPDADNPGQQWRTHAHFLPRDGDAFSLRLPWGLLPKLRPGAVVGDGYIAGQLNLENPLTFAIKSLRFERWQDATRDEEGWFRLPELQAEWCLVADTDAEPLVFPCIQALRAFHASVRLICHAILRPATWSEFGRCELHEETLTLHVARLVPEGIVTRMFARYLARLLTETAWAESFSSVFHHRLADAKSANADTRSRIPLKCAPPELPAMRWTVRAQPLSNGAYFAWDLLRTTSSVRSPYRYLRVVHAHRKAPTPRERRDTKVNAESGDGTGRNAGPRQYDPRQLSRPLLLRQKPVVHEDAIGPKVSDSYPIPASGAPQLGGGRSRGPFGSGGEPRASLDEERVRGGTRSGEFHGIPGRDDPPLHFLVFAKALADAVADMPEWQIRFSLEELVSHVPTCKPSDRLVLFARIETPTTVAHLVELEPLEGQAPYTLLVVRRTEPATATAPEIGHRLNRWLTNRGRSHLKALLEEDPDFEVLLSTHRDLGTRGWAERILNKVSPPDRRPSWTRGIAGA